MRKSEQLKAEKIVIISHKQNWLVKRKGQQRQFIYHKFNHRTKKTRKQRKRK